MTANEIWREKRETDRSRKIGLERNGSRRRERAFEERAAVRWNSRRANFRMHDKGNLRGLGTYSDTETHTHTTTLISEIRDHSYQDVCVHIHGDTCASNSFGCALYG